MSQCVCACVVCVVCVFVFVSDCVVCVCVYVCMCACVCLCVCVLHCYLLLFPAAEPAICCYLASPIWDGGSSPPAPVSDARVVGGWGEEAARSG